MRHYFSVKYGMSCLCFNYFQKKHSDISQRQFTDKTQSVIPKDRVIESLGQIESQQSVYLILTGKQDVREVRTIEDPFPMRLQKVASEIKHGT